VDPTDLARAVAAEVERLTPGLVKAAVAALPPPQDGHTPGEAEIVPLVARSVEAAVAALPPGPPGQDANPEVIAQMVKAAVAALPPPADGHTPGEAELAPLVARSVETAVAALPPGPAGKDADPAVIVQMVERAVAALPPPADGHTPGEAELAPLVARSVEAAVAALPPGPAGKDADPTVTAWLVETALAAAVRDIPRPADGKSVTVEELHPVIEQVVERSLAARPAPKDGVGLTGALIDRAGRLVLTLSDGSVKELGVVLGKDADMDALAAVCVREIEKIPRPRDGADGLGFEDLQVIHDGERQVTIRFVRGEHVKDFPLTIPAIIDRGIWRPGRYAKGDGVTWDGSFFIAQTDTSEKPLLHPDWRQAVKAGRPGKHTESVKYLPATVKAAPLPDPNGADHAAP
jgi:hypothetical protein